MNELKQDVWLANSYQTKHSNFITHSLSIERCSGYSEDNNTMDGINAQDEGSDYALNIVSSPLMEPEYLEGEFLAEFENVVRGLREMAEEDDAMSESSDDRESYMNSVDLEDGTTVICRPIVLLTRLPDSYIELMTQRNDSGISEDVQSNDETESEFEIIDEEMDITDDLVTEDTDELESDEEGVYQQVDIMADDLITEAVIMTSNDLANQEIELYMGDVNDFDGPEVTIGGKSPVPTPNIFITESIALTVDTCKLRMYQPKVVLTRLPPHTVLAFTPKVNSQKSPAKKKVCTITNDRIYIYHGSHFKLIFFFVLLLMSLSQRW